ncbi:hypothetical protein Q8W30_14915 [Neptunomonas phycophila]|uniref:Uncharacterized protein n=1 Tax=Neptunomonas phycophila TaxID=1572645 RepID=A0ABT9EXV3_9GAMM|nr:hypothetical protein [Neptunomonas phycophila]MDP2523865.1 hypothetical protein [Neptunomonas phycophila]
MNILLIICTSVLVIVIWMIVDHYRMKKVATERGNPNICEYARSFDYRNVDTKIMREVWNEVQLNLGSYNGKPFPVKSDDMFEETYSMHPDDLDDIYWSVADRLGIDTEKPESNPYFNKVTSVKNLVLFLHNQPRTSNA